MRPVFQKQPTGASVLCYPPSLAAAMAAYGKGHYVSLIALCLMPGKWAQPPGQRKAASDQKAGQPTLESQ